MKSIAFCFLLVVLSLSGAALAQPLESIGAEMLQPGSDIDVYNSTSFDIEVNVSCSDNDCDEINVTLYYVSAPRSCMEILEADPGSADGIYSICPDGENCVDVHCDMADGGWASIFTLDDSLTLDSRACILNHNNDDMDSTGMWADLSAKVKSDNNYETYDSTWYTWERDGTNNTVPGSLPDRPGGLGDFAHPVPLPAVNKTIWFDWENSVIAWGGNSVGFDEIGLPHDNGDVWDMMYYRYYISDGASMIHTGKFYDGCEWQDAKLLEFDFTDNTITVEDAKTLNPPNGIWGTEQDAFAHVLFTVNGRVMYFNGFPDSTHGSFALGGTLLDPNSDYDAYTVPSWEPNQYYNQGGLDFFSRVDESGYLWFGDWGHDDGGYFDCGNDNYFGVGRTNIMLSYDDIGSADAMPVSESAGATPFYTTDSNPQTIDLSQDESELVGYSVFATKPGTFFLFALANETHIPYVSDETENRRMRVFEGGPPTPFQLYPKDGKKTLSAPFSLNFSCEDGVIDTIQLWTDMGSPYGMAYSDNSYTAGDVVSYPVPALDVGNYTWAVWCNGTNGESAWSPNRTLQVFNEGIFECMELDAPGAYTLMDDLEVTGNCFDISADDVTLDCDGHLIESSGGGCGGGDIGIYTDRYNSTIVNCNVAGFQVGIYFDLGSSYGTVMDSSIDDCWDEGVYIYSSSNHNITGSNFTDNDDGVYIEADEDDADYNSMTYNRFIGNYDGIYLDYADYNSIMHNYFEGNDYGFYLWYADHNQIGLNYLSETDTSNLGGSCPFLYLWDGDGYDYYTDLASESLGSANFETPLYEAGIYELGDFKSEGGTYRLKVREVIPETDFFDEAKLVVVDVPEGYGVLNEWHNTYSDDIPPPKDFITIKDPKAPVSASDKYGNDVLAQVSGKDGAPLPMQGDDPNWVIVDFGSIDNPQYAKLIITGWTAYGTDVTLPKQKNLRIETLDDEGNWQEARLFGKFTGDSRTFVFDIADILTSDDTRMRISAGYSKSNTNIIDQILLDDSEPVEIGVTYLEPTVADLRWGGSTSIDYGTSEHRISATDEQLPVIDKFLMYGNFTKYGDVRSLLAETDDMFAIMRHGDELALEFEDIAPADGMDRHVFLLADVMYSIKYTSSRFVSDTIEPMPFHGMSEYPYGDGESYPYDAEHIAYIEDWNTRVHEPPERYGGSLPWSFNNTVFENIFDGDMYSIALSLYGEESTSVLRNNISGVEVGIDIYQSASCLIEDNRIFSERGRGMIIRQESEGNDIIGNVISSDSSEDCDYDGCGAVFVGRSDNNYFEGNIMTAINGLGMMFGYSDDNDVYLNNISAEDDYVLVLTRESEGNTFLENNIRGDSWVYDEVGGNDFSDESVGNRYYFEDGTPSWLVFDIFDDGADGWADSGADHPFNNEVLGDDLWNDLGVDEHPAVSGPVPQQPQPEDDDDKALKPELSLSLESSCESSYAIVTSKGKPVSGAKVEVFEKDSLITVASGVTDADGKLSFTGCGVDVRAHASKSGYSSADIASSLIGCNDCGPLPECSTDLDCEVAQRCSDGACTAVPCQCGYVADHTCIEYPCCSDSDCKAGETCSEHVCIAWEVLPGCTSDSECAEGESCKGHACVLAKPPGQPGDDAMAQAEDAIADAQSAIDDAKSAGKDTAKAEALLASAKEAFDSGDYEKAEEIAGEVKGALGAESEEEGSAPTVPGEGQAQPDSGWLSSLVFILAIALLLGGAFWLIKPKK